LWLLAIHRRDRRVPLSVAAVGTWGLALLPIALSQRPRASWIVGWPLEKRLVQIPQQYLVGTGAPAQVWLELAGAVAVLLAAMLLAGRADAAERRGATVAGLLAGAGLVLSLALVLAGVDELITRNVIAILVPIIVLVAAGLGARRAGPLGLAGVGVLCAIGVAAAIGVATDRNLQRPDWRGVARVLGPAPVLSAGVTGRAILIQHYKHLQPLSLYLPHLHALRGDARVTELDVVSFTAPPSGGFCWWGSACNLWPSRAQGAYPVPGFHELWRREVYQFTVVRLVADDPVELQRRAVSRALVTTKITNDALLFQPAS
jgi:hypothetical protein